MIQHDLRKLPNCLLSCSHVILLLKSKMCYYNNSTATWLPKFKLINGFLLSVSPFLFALCMFNKPCKREFLFYFQYPEYLDLYYQFPLFVIIEINITFFESAVKIIPKKYIYYFVNIFCSCVINKGVYSR